MAKRIQLKLSRPMEDIIFDAACAAAFDKAGRVLNCLFLSKSSRLYRSNPEEYLENAHQHAVALSDFAALAGSVFTPEWFLRNCTNAKDHSALIDEAIALADSAPMRRAA